MSLWGVWEEGDLEIGQRRGMRKQAQHAQTLLKGGLLGRGELGACQASSAQPWARFFTTPKSDLHFQNLVTKCTFSPFILFLFTVHMSLKLSVCGTRADMPGTGSWDMRNYCIGH